MKLTNAQRIGLSEAIKGYLEGSKLFKVFIHAKVANELSATSIRFERGDFTERDIQIARFFFHLPYTRNEDLRRRAAQENAFRTIDSDCLEVSRIISEREKELFKFIKGDNK